jgi:hypothetical protein
MPMGIYKTMMENLEKNRLIDQLMSHEATDSLHEWESYPTDFQEQSIAFDNWIKSIREISLHPQSGFKLYGKEPASMIAIFLRL